MPALRLPSPVSGLSEAKRGRASEAPVPSTIRPRPRRRPVQLSALLLLGGAALAAARPLLGAPRASEVPIEDTSRPPRHRGLTPLTLLVGALAVAGATSAALRL